MIDWGNVPAWIAAVGTVGSLLALLTIVRNELRSRKALEEENWLREARRVATWWDSGEAHPFNSRYVIRVQNAGDTPIYNCVVHVGPSRQSDSVPYVIHFRTVPPESTMTKPVSEDWIRMEPQDVDFPGAWAEVVFTDSSGRRWRRDSDGRLFAMETTEVRGVKRRIWRRKREPA